MEGKHRLGMTPTLGPPPGSGGLSVCPNGSPECSGSFRSNRTPTDNGIIFNACNSPHKASLSIPLSIMPAGPSAALVSAATAQAATGLYNNPLYSAGPRPLPDTIALDSRKVSVRNAAKLYKNFTEAQVQEYNQALEEVRSAAVARWSSKAVQDRIELTAGRWAWQLSDWIPRVDAKCPGPIEACNAWRADVVGSYAHHYLFVCVCAPSRYPLGQRLHRSLG